MGRAWEVERRLKLTLLCLHSTHYKAGIFFCGPFLKLLIHDYYHIHVLSYWCYSMYKFLKSTFHYVVWICLLVARKVVLSVINSLGPYNVSKFNGYAQGCREDCGGPGQIQKVEPILEILWGGVGGILPLLPLPVSDTGYASSFCAKRGKGRWASFNTTSCTHHTQ